MDEDWIRSWQGTQKINSLPLQQHGWEDFPRISGPRRSQGSGCRCERGAIKALRKEAWDFWSLTKHQLPKLLDSYCITGS